MALRFLQIFLPRSADTRIEALLEGSEVLGTWRDTEATGRMVVHLLVPAEEAEPIMDRFAAAFVDVPGFRILLMPVEAVLPRAAKTGADPAVESEKEKKKSRGSRRISREELYTDITESLGVSRIYAAMVVLSAIVAAAGLLRDDVAIIIGAMVIAPLLGPNVAISLSTTLGDLSLLRKALITNAAGFFLALGVAMAIGFSVPVDPEVPAIASRIRVDFSDLVLALAAGAAGALAFTRGLSGAVIGVMVAVALVPPLVTFGLLLGAGEYARGWNALLLVAANVVCINLAGVVTFLAQGVGPRTWWEEKRAVRARRIALAAWFFLLIALAVIIYVTRPME